MKRTLRDLYLDALHRERHLRSTVQQTAQWLRRIGAKDPIVGTQRENDCVTAANTLERAARKPR